MSGVEESDASLVEKARRGDRAAFGALIAPQTARMLALATRMLGSSAAAEESVQDAMASVWVARDRLDPARPFAAFLTTAVLNKCRDRLRRRKVKGLFGLAPQLDELSIADDDPDPERRAIDRDELARVRSGIETLPVKLREALVLVGIDGRSQREAAELLAVSEKTIETRIYRARKILREKIARF